MTPFIIYALPRSRTYWLSKYLSYGQVKCGHDELRHVRGLDDVKSLLAMPYYGSAETAAAPWWRLIHAMAPALRTVVVRRDPDEVVASLLATNVRYDAQKLRAQIYKLDAKLDQITKRVYGVLSFKYEDLRRADKCGELFEFCTGAARDPQWFAQLSAQRLVCDLEAMTRYYHAHQAQLDRVGRVAKQRILARLVRRPVVSSSMTFQQEPFEDFLRDGQKLFAQHLVEVGEHPDNWENKNLDLMRAMERLGALYVTTARSNGRMFGYLMSIVAPALDTRTGLDAVQTLFYASPDAPNIGLKLQRASLEFLRTVGVDQVSFRAGVRGTGEKQASLFKRLGAEHSGQMFLVDFKETV